MAESGYPGFRAATWFGVAVPAATPSPVAQRLREAINHVIAKPEFRSRFQTLGLVIQPPRGQVEIDAYVQEDRDRWATVIKQNDIRLD